MDNSKKPELKNPKKGANWLSQLFFCWLMPIMYKGTRRGLNTADLTKCLRKDKSEDLGDKLELEWEEEINRARSKNKDPHLRTALFYTFYKSCIFDGFLVFLFCLLKSVSPVVLAQLLIQFQRPPSNLVAPSNETSTASPDTLDYDAPEELYTETPIINYKVDESIVDTIGVFLAYIWNDVYWLSSGVCLLTLICCFLLHHADLRQRLVGAQMRIACCSVIYRKTLRISKKVAGQTAAGYLVNLLSNDVGRLDYGFIYLHYVWILPFQAVLICYLIWREIRYAALVGVIGLLIKTIPVQTALGRLSSILRMRVAKRTDDRVNIMNEIINGIQVIKMYAWEKPFNAVVALARKKEVNQIKWASYIRGFYLSTMVFTERSTLFITIIACVLENRPVTADVVFSMAQFFNILQLTAAIFYPMAVSFGAEALVSINRVQDFLQLEDQDKTVQGLHKNEIEIIDASAKIDAIDVINLSATWEDYKKKTLDFLNIKVKRGSLCAIIGPVGSGKSSLLQLLLGELPIYSGDVIINGDISYSSQEPWLFTESIRNNILFGLPYDKRRYNDVIKHCALRTDFMQLPYGDQTMVGERGTSLSGGQRARVSLARAVYKNSNIYLLDDPLSAVDAHVGKHLFDECIGPDGYLAKQGNTRVLVTHQVHFLKEADWIVILEEGKVLAQGSYQDLIKSDIDFGKLLQREEKAEDDFEEEDVEEYVEDYIPFIDGTTHPDDYMTLRSSVLSLKARSSQNISAKSSISNIMNRQAAEHQAEGGVSFKVWTSYFAAGGNCCILFILFLALILSQVVTSGSDYFVTYWTQQEFLRIVGSPTVLSTWELLYIYGGFILAVIIMTVFRNFLFFNICMRSSKKLHNKMFASLLNAPMRFFDTNPSGRILNRFSKDMGAIDELLPKAMIEATQIILVMFGILAMVSVVNSLLLVPLAFAVILFGCVLRFYLRPAQDLKRLEGITKSPVFSHLSATLNGLSTIRANNVEDKVAQEFDNLQNVHSAVWQLTMSSNTALGLWLDCISTAFVACVTFSFIVLDQEIFSSNVGLAISQALILTGMVQYGIRQTTETIQQMTCVERVLQYTNLPQEVSQKNRQPPKDWPWKGRIEFKSMSLVYDLENGVAVLKNLNLNIEPTWKVGIVGRTGAGKSSLISAMFRLADIEGSILIDGIDTGTIGLEGLRSKISIIPQDPVLFSATIRYNLDPFNRYKDDEIWRALSDVELKNAIGGLEYMVTEAGSNFSVGQRQLLCLARAILRNNKILVLDEATANVDPQTDSLIQTTIREKFKNCTVLTVAHRLHTVMDSDRILVMDDGFAKEYDIPHKLLQNSEGILRNMVDATGPQESESLKRIAEETFKNMNVGATVEPSTNLWKFKDK